MSQDDYTRMWAESQRVKGRRVDPLTNFRTAEREGEDDHG